jgi:hypothetical protein
LTTDGELVNGSLKNLLVKEAGDYYFYFVIYLSADFSFPFLLEVPSTCTTRLNAPALNHITHCL